LDLLQPLAVVAAVAVLLVQQATEDQVVAVATHMVQVLLSMVKDFQAVHRLVQA
jgi:hypothetical protein